MNPHRRFITVSKLIAYDGKAITYDAIGNPLTYNGYTYSWEGGRRLKGITGNNNSISYKYNDSGIRTEKIVNGLRTSYILSGDKVLAEKTTYDIRNDETIHYTYDASNKLVSMNIFGSSDLTINGEYYYIRNVQGDIIGLIDKTGTEVVTYTYDTWGKLISIEGSKKDTVGVKNTYRYRGYRYDTEIGLYYLNARYYNPEWGRFINADALVGEKGTLLAHNVFAYCSNDPVNLHDPSGNFIAALPWVIGSVIAAVKTVVTAIAVAVGAAVLKKIVKVVAKNILQDVVNETIKYSEKNEDKDNQEPSSQQNKERPTNSGKAKNKLKPNIDALGDHTTFKRNPNTGEITNYETWSKNPKNPTGFDSNKRYDGVGRPHKNPLTGEELMPHVHDKTAPGKVREPIPWEIPIKQ